MDISMVDYANKINTECPTNLINDIPALDDYFKEGDELGPHERVSVTISDLISNTDELDGKLIGLEGGWGTGKSTIISFLQRDFIDNQSIKFHLFDTWAHEGDPLRRTFLESLINSFIKYEWVVKKEWEEEKDLLAKRKRTETRIFSEGTTGYGKLITLLTFLATIGLIFIDSSLDIGLTICQCQPNWYFWIGVFLISLLPLAVILNSSQEKDSRFNFFKEKPRIRRREEVAITPDPTSIEFEIIFKKLLKKAFHEHEERKLILILDNLDRVKSEDALLIWSTLQTFFQDITKTSEEYYKQLVVIVPFDRKGISSLWEQEPLVQVNHAEALQPISVIKDNTITNSFIDKSFQLIFQVPPIILSQWKDFLFDLLSEALPNHKPVEFEKVYRILNLCYLGQANPPTPRELIKVINQIGVCHRQWGDKFALEVLAYYVFSRDRYNYPSVLIDGMKPTHSERQILPKDCSNSLAALFFNVGVEKARQLLLITPIQEQLKNTSVNRLLDYKSIHSKGFDAVFQYVLENYRVPSNDFLKAATVIHESTVLDSLDEIVKQSCVYSLANIMEEVDRWEVLDDSKAAGLICLAKILGQKYLKNIYLKLTQTTLLVGKNSEADVEAVSNQIDLICGVYEAFKDIDKSFEPPFKLQFNINMQSWHIVSEKHSEYIETVGKLFRSDKPAKVFEEYFVSQITAGIFANKDHSDFVRLNLDAYKDANWHLILESFKDRFGGPTELTIAEIENIIKCINAISYISKSEKLEFFKYLSESGIYLHYLSMYNNEDGHKVLSKLFPYFLKFCPSGKPVSEFRNSNSGQSVFNSILNLKVNYFPEELLNYFSEEKGFLQIFKIIDSTGSYSPLLIDLQQKLLKNFNSQEVLPPQELYNRWKAIKNSYDTTEIKFDNLLKTLIHKDSFIKEIVDPKNEFSVSNKELYKLVFDNIDSEEFKAYLCDKLTSLTAENWKTELLDDSGIFLYIALKLNSEGYNISLNNNYKFGIENFIEVILEKPNIKSEYLVSSEPYFLDIADKDLKSSIKSTILDMAISQKSRLNRNFLNVFNNVFIDKELLQSYRGVISNLFSPMIRSLNEDNIEWLLHVLEADNKFLYEIGDSNEVREFKDRISSILETNNELTDKTKKLLITIAELLSIEKYQK